MRKTDPIYYFKSKKNKTEIQNSIKSHIYDGVALTKFIFWLKDNYKKRKRFVKSRLKINYLILEKNVNFLKDQAFQQSLEHAQMDQLFTIGLTKKLINSLKMEIFI